MSVLWYLDRFYGACARVIDAARSKLIGAPANRYGLCTACYGSGYNPASSFACIVCGGYGTVLLNR